MSERGRAGAPGGAEPLTGADESALLAACDALGLAIGPAQVGSMLAYLELLRRWNTTYNLTAVRDPHAMVVQHLVDCLAAVAALERSAILGESGSILDVGSGAGLPGVLLAICRPGWAVTCIDAVAKKAAFLRQAAGVLDLPNLVGVHARVEQWRPVAGAEFDLITARAFASLHDLTRLTGHLLKQGGCWMAMKGQVPEAEIAELPPEIEMFHVEPLTVPGLEAARCLVWLRRRRDSFHPDGAAQDP